MDIYLGQLFHQLQIFPCAFYSHKHTAQTSNPILLTSSHMNMRKRAHALYLTKKKSVWVVVPQRAVVTMTQGDRKCMQNQSLTAYCTSLHVTDKNIHSDVGKGICQNLILTKWWGTALASTEIHNATSRTNIMVYNSTIRMSFQAHTPLYIM